MNATSTSARRSPSAELHAPLARFAAWLDAHAGATGIVLYAVALGLRLLYLAEFRHGLLAHVPLMDEAFYKNEAASLLRGAPAVSDAEFMTPLYPRFLSLVFRIVGDGPVGPFAVQFVLGALAAPLTFLVGRRALPAILAFATGLAVATFAPLVFFEGLFLVEGLVLLGLLAALSFAVLDPAGRRGALLSGAALGFAALGRGSNLLLALPLGAWFVWHGRPHRRAARRAALFGASCLLVLAPLLARNAVRAGRPLLLTANAGFNLYVGNGPPATGIFVRIPGLDLQQDPLTLRYVQRQLHHPVTASETSDYWTARTLDWVRRHPGRTAQLFLWKLILFWNRMSIPQVEGFEAASPGTILSRAPLWRSFAFLPLGLLGLWLGIAAVLRRARPVTEAERVRALLGVSAAVYSLSIAIFFVTDRYRVPLLPWLMLLAACSLDVLRAGFAPERRRWLPLLGLAVAMCFVITDPRLLGVDQRRMWRDLHVHTALRYSQAGQFESALREYRAARGLDPQDPDVRDGLARMLGRAGQDSLALVEFQSLLRDRPDDARTWYNLGNLYRRLGRRESALEAYRRALELEPGRESAWNQSGEVYRSLGDTARAAEAYRQALAVVPGYEQALNNLGALRAEQGHAAEAEAGFRVALAVNGRYLPAMVNLGILLTDSGRHAEALATWRRVLTVDPGNETARRLVHELDPRASALPRPGRAGRQPGEGD